MSRYGLVPVDERYEVVVGYDDPLDTFFAQVLDPSAEGDEDDVVLWIGTRPGEIRRVAELAARIHQHALIPEQIGRALSIDRGRREPPTDFQRSLFAAVTGKELP